MAITLSPLSSTPLLPPLFGVEALRETQRPAIPEPVAPLPLAPRAPDLPPGPPRLTDDLVRALILQQAAFRPPGLDPDPAAQALSAALRDAVLGDDAQPSAQDLQALARDLAGVPTPFATAQSVSASPGPPEPDTVVTPPAEILPPALPVPAPPPTAAAIVAEPADPAALALEPADAPPPPAITQPPAPAETSQAEPPAPQPAPVTLPAAAFSPILAQYLAIDRMQEIYVAPNGERPGVDVLIPGARPDLAPIAAIPRIDPVPAIARDLRV